MPTDAPPEVVAAFTAATITTFEELTQTLLTPGDASFTRTAPPADRVIAVITLRGTVEGRLVVAYPDAVIASLTSRYLTQSTPLTPELLADAAGEFANVIAGQAKTMLQGTPFHYTLSTPRVWTFGDLAGAETEYLILPFHADVGGFTIFVALPSAPH